MFIYFQAEKIKFKYCKKCSTIFAKEIQCLVKGTEFPNNSKLNFYLHLHTVMGYFVPSVALKKSNLTFKR